MTIEADLQLADGRTLHYYDTADTADAGASGPATGVAVFWEHGTPNAGDPPEPLFRAAAEHGLRWVSYDRPGYCGSDPNPGRDVASGARDVTAIADALGVGQFAAVGHSGGGPHALAAGALLPDRVLAVVSISAPAPHGADGLDWFAGWSPSGIAEQQAALAGRTALEQYLASAEFDEETFTPADHAALNGSWSWLMGVVRKAMAAGDAGMVDDLLAGARPWGFSVADMAVPVLIMHGSQDRMVPSGHAEWLAAQIPGAELRLTPGDGHVSVLDSAPAALEWLSGRIAA